MLLYVLKELILLECADMDYNDHYKDILKELCIKMIKLLDELKANGSIGEKEYQEHICKKKDFLNDIH